MKVFVFQLPAGACSISGCASMQPANYVIILPDDSRADDIIRKAAGVGTAIDNQLRWQQLK